LHLESQLLNFICLSFGKGGCFVGPIGLWRRAGVAIGTFGVVIVLRACFHTLNYYITIVVIIKQQHSQREPIIKSY